MTVRAAGRRVFFKRAGSAAAAVLALGRAPAEAGQAGQQCGAGTDRALWISWYDLPDAGKDAYLSWLHQTYIPSVMKRPGYLWAAHYATVPRDTMRTMRRDGVVDKRLDSTLPTGDRYMLLFGAADANVFGNPSPSELHKSLSEVDRKMLATRTGERVNIMIEAARVEGPEAASYTGGMALAPCIQLGNFQSAYQDEEELHAWYAQSRMPRMKTLPGTVRTRKLASVAGWAKGAILYEFSSLEARNKYYMTMEEGQPGMKEWADRVVPKLVHAPGSATLGTRIWPA